MNLFINKSLKDITQYCIKKNILNYKVSIYGYTWIMQKKPESSRVFIQDTYYPDYNFYKVQNFFKDYK